MTDRQIDTRQVPPQSWVIVNQMIAPRLAGSSALTEVPRVLSQSPVSTDINYAASSASLEDKLFDNAAELKISLSRVVMHLSPDWRGAIFKQLDALLDHDSWQEDSAFIQKSTFMTFLRFVIFASPAQLPSLGVGSTGHILAAWYNETQQVAVEFLANDRAGATFVKEGVRSKEAVAWRGHVADLMAFLTRNDMADVLQGDPL